MIITSGILKVKLPNEDWKTVNANQEFFVEPNVSFDVDAAGDVSYICYYK